VPCPCPRDGGSILKALLTLTCALIVLALPAALVVTASPAEAKPQQDLGAQLAAHAAAEKRSRQVIRFFETHEWLLSDPRFSEEANRQLALHKGKLAKASRQLNVTKVAIATRKRLEVERRARKLAVVEARKAAEARGAAEKARPEGPRRTICKVFGDYCDEALDVAHCESRFLTSARNGQYLGLFQMGSSERTLFGHGSTAREQAEAAHKYFVAAGRDWSPWSCKP
jgi:hypothetical protein